jgi:hypothetical protein
MRYIIGRFMKWKFTRAGTDNEGLTKTSQRTNQPLGWVLSIFILFFIVTRRKTTFYRITESETFANRDSGVGSIKNPFHWRGWPVLRFGEVLFTDSWGSVIYSFVPDSPANRTSGGSELRIRSRSKKGLRKS